MSRNGQVAMEGCNGQVFLIVLSHTSLRDITQQRGPLEYNNGMAWGSVWIWVSLCNFWNIPLFYFEDPHNKNLTLSNVI